jgi:hypothetical protein
MSAPMIDFAHAKRTAWLGWIVLALGVAALGTALRLDQRWTTQRADQQASLQARLDAAEQQRRDALRPVPPSPDRRRLQRIAPQLRQPWLTTLRVIEGVTQPPVFLLGLSIDPASGGLRLEGEAPSFEEALAYAKSLGEGDALGRAELRSHELMNDPSGRASVRFTVVTQWSAR